MALLSQSIRNLFGGVSQAPAEQRDASQFSELVNSFPIYGQKLGRRPPLLHIAKLTADDLDGSFAHTFGDNTLIVAGGVVRVFDSQTGTEKAVNMLASGSYLAGNAFKAITVGDTAYLLNTSVTVLKAPAISTIPVSSAHVTVRAGDYETTYTITLDGVAYAVTTPAAGGVGAKADTTTTAIATALRTAILGGAAFQCTRFGSTLYIRKASGAAFTASTADGLADTGLSLAKDTVKAFADLPPLGEVGTVLEIVGENGTDVDNYFVRCTSPDGGITLVSSLWEECSEPGTEYLLDESTLPLRIAPDGSGGFDVNVCPWAERQAGDDTTVPFPSFVDKALRDLFVYEGRLGFIHGNAIVLSQAGEFFNFFRTSAAQILSDDPIDINASLSGVSQFDWCVNWNEALYLFADGRAQFRLIGNGDEFTVSTVSLKKVSTYRYDVLIRPVPAGRRMFYVANQDAHPHVFDYHLTGVAREHEAIDIGLHVPTYITGTPLVLAVDDSQGLLLLTTSTATFVYNYRTDEEGRRVQGAWSKWTFGDGTVLAMDVNIGSIAFVMAYGHGTYLNEMILEPERLLIYEGFELFDGGDDFDGPYFYDGGASAVTSEVSAVHLDRYIDSTHPDLSVVFDGVYTLWTLPYRVAMNGSDGVLAVTGNDPSTFLTITRPSPTTAKALGDFTGITTRVGVVYETTITLSTIFYRSRDSGQADTRGRLQLRWVRISYRDVTRLDVTVAGLGRAARVYQGVSGDGELLVPILLRNTDCTVTIRANTAGADALTGFSWEGSFESRTALR